MAFGYRAKKGYVANCWTSVLNRDGWPDVTNGGFQPPSISQLFATHVFYLKVWRKPSYLDRTDNPDSYRDGIPKQPPNEEDVLEVC